MILIKYNAFFQIFPSEQKIVSTIKKVLDTHREKSRYFIIKQILVELRRGEHLKINELEKEALSYTDKYNTIVEKRAVECDEIRGACKSLEELSKLYTLYINSTTLKRIIPQRSLWKYFRGVYGEPIRQKIVKLKLFGKKEGHFIKKLTV